MTPVMTPLDTGRRQEAAKILERCVVLTLTVHFLGNHRKVSTRDVVEAVAGEDAVTDAIAEGRNFDTEQVRSTKLLVPTEVLRPAMRIIRKAKDYLRSKGIAAHRVFGERSYLIPRARITEVDEMLTSIETELRDEATRVADAYLDAMAKQELALGPLFDRAQYPDPARVAGAFSIDWSYVSFQAPENLETVNRAVAAAAARSAEARFSEAFREVQLAMRGALHTTMKDLIAKLRPTDTGKSVTIRGTLLRDVRQIVEDFRINDVTDDAELAELVRRLDVVTGNVDVDALRGDEGRAERERLAGELDAALRDANQLVTVARRGISMKELSDVA